MSPAAVDAGQPFPAVRHNLPPQATPFVGRARELAQVAARLADPACRLLTVIGPGGIGKTRLAIEAAATQVDCFADGVRFVDVAPVAAANLLPDAISAAPDGGRSSAFDPRRRLLAHVRDRHLLLLVDNFEHLAAEGEPPGGAGRGRARPGPAVVPAGAARHRPQRVGGAGRGGGAAEVAAGDGQAEEARALVDYVDRHPATAALTRTRLAGLRTARLAASGSVTQQPEPDRQHPLPDAVIASLADPVFGRAPADEAILCVSQRPLR